MGISQQEIERVDLDKFSFASEINLSHLNRCLNELFELVYDQFSHYEGA